MTATALKNLAKKYQMGAMFNGFRDALQNIMTKSNVRVISHPANVYFGTDINEAEKVMNDKQEELNNIAADVFRVEQIIQIYNAYRGRIDTKTKALDNQLVGFNKQAEHYNKIDQRIINKRDKKQKQLDDKKMTKLRIEKEFNQSITAFHMTQTKNTNNQRTLYGFYYLGYLLYFVAFTVGVTLWNRYFRNKLFQQIEQNKEENKQLLDKHYKQTIEISTKIDKIDIHVVQPSNNEENKQSIENVQDLLDENNKQTTEISTKMDKIFVEMQSSNNVNVQEDLSKIKEFMSQNNEQMVEIAAAVHESNIGKTDDIPPGYIRIDMGQNAIVVAAGVGVVGLIVGFVAGTWHSQN